MFDINNLKALAVVLVLGVVGFRMAKPLCLQIMRPETYTRRRRVWFALTVVAFVSPNFFTYAIFALCLLWWAQRRDDNPLGLYGLVLFAIPNTNFFLPTILIGQLFDLTQYRILSFVVLIPTIVRAAKESSASGARRFEFLDIVLLAFLLLQVVLNMPYETFTTTMRRAFLFAIDTFVLFYAFARIGTRERLADAMTGFFVATLIMALVAIFESAKGWLLYTNLAGVWGNPNAFAWLMRGDRLRAQAAAEHSINLGYQLAMGLGFFLYLKTRLRQPLLNAAIGLAFGAALLATASRGPWVTAAAVWVVFTLCRPNALRKLGGAVLGASVIFTVMYFTPLRESVIDRLPFVGNADQDTIEYRRQLADLSWRLILEKPLFGDPFAPLKMESLRQGQGIIDIVNGYIFTLLFTGFAGLSLVMTVFLGALYQGVRTVICTRQDSNDAAMLSASLVSCLVASLVYTAAAGYGSTTYLICGLLVSGARIFLKRERSRGTATAPRGLSSASPARA